MIRAEPLKTRLLKNMRSVLGAPIQTFQSHLDLILICWKIMRSNDQNLFLAFDFSTEEAPYLFCFDFRIGGQLTN